MANDGITDVAVIYQLEKVDQGGAVADLFEDRIAFLASAWEFDICEDDNCPHYGEIVLPDGRHAGLTFEAYITTEGKHEPQG